MEGMTNATKGTQRMRIMRHLEAGKTLTSKQAMDEYGIMQLPSRISELRQRGEKIEKKTIRVLNRYGEEVRVTEYSLKEEQSGEAV